NEELPLKEKVTLDVENESLQQILEILSTKFALIFTRINNIITVKKKESDRNKPHGFGTLRGIVRDSTTTEVLPYANVYIKGLNTGASTDNRGFFLIPSIPADQKYTVIVTYVGYTPKKVYVFMLENKITQINVYLSMSAAYFTFN
ncbi:MAG: carboxypeptidase-like regulatory domain-containing protein, partial [Ignavibacteriaceae bacterium]